MNEELYEGGMAAASPAEMTSRQSLETHSGWKTLDGTPQSLHVATADAPLPNSFDSVPDFSPQGVSRPEVAGQKRLGPEISVDAKKDALCDVPFGDCIGSCGSFLLQKFLEVTPLCSQYTGKGSVTDIFPLPTSRTLLAELEPSLDESSLSWLCCVAIGLNSVWGSELFYEGPMRLSQRKCMLGLIQDVKRFCGLECPLEKINWKEYLKVRSIDYKGDEVKVVRWFKSANVAAALPSEVGSVPLEEVVTMGCKHYVLNFDLYLKPRSEWKLVKSPKVMVEDCDWGAVCKGLVSSGVCTWIEEDEIFDTGEGPLLNGLFGVSKDDWTSSGTEIFRLIMNLIPLNHLCLPLAGDIHTLPSWSGMSPFFLQPSEGLLVTSEDVKCFFYVMRVPPCWFKYLAFNKLVPQEALPDELKGRRIYVASRVLPMGFLNSVSLAQHVHRNLVLGSRLPGQLDFENPAEAEIRKDLPFTSGVSCWRVYLDNYDLLEKVEATRMVELEGQAPAGVLALRHEYERWSVPRNVKKSVVRSSHCEVQGATIDGELGVAFPRESKLAKYFSLSLQLAFSKRATQRQWQVALGGLVYFTMFRRQLLGCLNKVWQHVEAYNMSSFFMRETPPECASEVLRVLCLLPLARMDFRLDMHPLVTCSDASTQGGGACVSNGVTPFGPHVAQGRLRGELVENNTEHWILSVGLFDGIGALRVALDSLGVRVLGHISVEKHQPAQRVVEAHYPGTIVVEDVTMVDETMVKQWSVQFSQCSLVLLGGGPPCQGVSGLNFDRKGALRDQRSSLFSHVSRIRDLLQHHFPWCPVHSLMESVLSMDDNDRLQVLGFSP